MTHTILLTNDDGIEAPGLAALAEAVADLGEVVVMAPPREMSASGHAISIKQKHTLRPFERDGKLFGHSFDGSPADCVKFALTKLLNQKPSLVISGINPGPNLGNNVPYSGTVAAALEGAMFGVPSMAVSLGFLPGGGRPTEFGTAAKIARQVAGNVLRNGMNPGTALSVNIPLLSESELRGFRVVRQGGFEVEDLFDEIAPTEDGATRYSNIGAARINSPEGSDTDDIAFRDGYVAITPLGYDMTAHSELDLWKSRLNGAE